MTRPVFARLGAAASLASIPFVVPFIPAEQSADHVADTLGQCSRNTTTPVGLLVIISVVAAATAAERVSDPFRSLSHGAGLHPIANHVWKVSGLGALVAADVQPLDAFGVSQVGVDAGDHHTQVHRQQLDADER